MKKATLADSIEITPQFCRVRYALLVVLAAATVNAQQTTAPKVNINAATLAQLEYLPGIGKVIAQRVVDYRTEHGQFRQVSDLLQVKGIGQKKLAALQPFVALSGATTLSGKVHPLHPSPSVPR